MKSPNYEFLKEAGRILNSGQSRTLFLTGNIHDLYRLESPEGVKYVPLVNFLSAQWNVSDRILVVYELNGPIRFINKGDRGKVRDAWLKWRTGLDANSLAIETMLATGKVQAELETMSKVFDANLKSAIGKPTVALEILRQMCLCSRTWRDARPFLREDLIIIIEAADMVVPEGEISRLSDADRHRTSICQDWFSDPGFMDGGDSVVFITESRSQINSRVARLPQVVEVQTQAPDEKMRKEFIEWFDGLQDQDKKLQLWSGKQELAKFTAGLSTHALMQLLKGATHLRRPLTLNDVVAKVESYIQSQLGEDIVEFKKPSHSLKDVVGFSKLKEFLSKELMPRFKSSGPDSMSGAAVCGPIGGGKTFIFEAVASELDMVALVLKNIRSQWFGQTDVIFERLRRVLDALAKVLIFVDEADTQFGGVGAETHSTERRLTGKIQAMMSDPKLRGKVVWLLMTARIHLLSPDIRRPGRVGDLIIPVLDPKGEDRQEFLRWVVAPVLMGQPTEDEMKRLSAAMPNYSAASFASLRAEFRAKAARQGDKLSFAEILEIVQDHIPPAIGQARRYQTLQALINCTRRSLLPDSTVGEKERQGWEDEILALEAKGVR
ncbi:MAG: ATP-binding protein [Deltaproteobacteria bacterium]|nr:ATP-binding protein [Deltaproteobacteria bacterium]MBW1871921.1 ATP-binding protein [Deltaproteobacteria bacterium]